MGFKVSTKFNENIVNDKLKLVLFKSMLKMQELATINAPFDTGLLAQRINLIPQIEGFSSYMLSAATDYAIHVEFGTKPHIIRIKDKKVLASKGQFFGTEIKHPGTEAQPFMRPALFQVKEVWLPRYMNNVLGKKGKNI